MWLPTAHETISLFTRSNFCHPCVIKNDAGIYISQAFQSTRQPCDYERNAEDFSLDCSNLCTEVRKRVPTL